MVKPNFFIAGAPKSGTSALAQYLSEHKSVFFSRPKETFYWCKDFPESKSIHAMNDLERYLQLFEDADPKTHLAVGEGSTTYLQSRLALEAIREFNPQSKVIAMLRNPIEVAVAMHGELVRHGFEDQADFATAWDLQQLRSRGQHLPSRPVFAHQLQYRDVANYPEQLDRLFRIFPASQCHIIVFDDFRGDVAQTYRRILQFLGLPDDQRQEFPTVHSAKVIRYAWISRLQNHPPPLLRGSLRLLKNWYYRNNGPIKRSLQKRLCRTAPRPPISADTRTRLVDAFRPDIERLSTMLGRDLTSWCLPPPVDQQPE